MPSSRWPSQIVSMPRSGKPTPNAASVARCSETSISSSDRPMITSGMTSGAATMPANSVLPKKRR